MKTFIVCILVLCAYLLMQLGTAQVSVQTRFYNSDESLFDSISLENGQYNYYTILLPTDQIISQGQGVGGISNGKSFFSHSTSLNKKGDCTNIGVSISTDSGIYSASRDYGRSENTDKPIFLNLAYSTANGNHEVAIWNNYGEMFMDLTSKGAICFGTSKVTRDAIYYSSKGAFQGSGELSQRFLLNGVKSIAIDVEGKGDANNFISQASLTSLRERSSIAALLSSKAENRGWLDAEIRGSVDEYRFEQGFKCNKDFNLVSMAHLNV